jgi:protein-disulfide isomerase
MNFEEFKNSQSQPTQDRNVSASNFTFAANNQDKNASLPQQPEQFLNQNSNYPTYSSGHLWWRWALLIIFALAVSAFAISVVMEIQQRQEKMNEIISKAEQMTVSGKLENNPLVQELIEKAANTTTTTSTGDSIIVKDRNRQLAERMSSPRLGSETSTLVIVEFVDFDCPACLEEFPIIRSIVNKYQNEILFIFRNYPFRGNNSIMLAQAAMCANEQGKFWQFHDRLFANQGKITKTEDVQRLAIMSGLNWNELNQCVISEKYQQQVVNDVQDAMDLGVKGTPTFFVNGNKLEGVVSVANWEEIIKKHKELNQK